VWAKRSPLGKAETGGVDDFGKGAEKSSKKKVGFGLSFLKGKKRVT